MRLSPAYLSRENKYPRTAPVMALQKGVTQFNTSIIEETADE